jgi:hypothetical protein
MPGESPRIALAAVVPALMVAGLGCGGDSQKAGTARTTASARTTPRVPAPPPPAARKPRRRYPARYKSRFVRLCARQGSLTRAQCRCIIDRAERTYSLRELVKAARDARKGRVSAQFQRIAASCV